MGAITYTHRTHPRARSLKIRVEAGGKVIVVTPRRVNQRAIENFLRESEQWILQQQAKLTLRSNFGLSADKILIFGKSYNRKQEVNAELTSGVKALQNSIHIRAKQKEKIATVLERFLKQTAERYIVPRTHQLAEKMQLSFGKISLRKQKTRWGSCTSAGNLQFNWQLVHAPTAVIDYVIIHELAHRQHMNHSSRFWNLVAQFDPDYIQHRNWLKRKGVGLS